jgi:4-hydroxybenzoate polyprenyltransferase
MNTAFRFLQYSHVFTALAAMSFTMASYMVLELTFNLAIVMTNFFGTLLIYNFQSLVYIAKPLTHVSEAKEWQKKHRRTIWFIIFLSAIWMSQLLAVFSQSIMLLYFTASILAIVYYLPKIGLKHFYYLKNVLLALVWSTVCVYIPVYQSEADIFPSIEDKSSGIDLQSIHFIIYYIFAFFLIVFISFWFDKRDSEIDVSNGNKTFATELTSKLYTKYLIIFSAIFLSALSVFSTHYLITVFLLFLYLFAMLLKLRKNNISFIKFGYWGDGLLIWFMLALFFTILVFECLAL